MSFCERLEVRSITTHAHFPSTLSAKDAFAFSTGQAHLARGNFTLRRKGALPQIGWKQQQSLTHFARFRRIRESLRKLEEVVKLVGPWQHRRFGWGATPACSGSRTRCCIPDAHSATWDSWRTHLLSPHTCMSHAPTPEGRLSTWLTGVREQNK